MANSLRASAVTTAFVGLVAVICLSLLIRSELELSDLYPLKAAAIFASVMLIAIAFLGDNHPFARLGAANHITTARAVLVALVASLPGEPRLPIVTAVAAAASLVVTVLDGVDGWLARRSAMASRFGARFDLEIDALLILVLALLAWEHGKAGPWIVLSGLLRYVFVAAGVVWPWLRYPLPSSRRRQTICVLQIVGLTLTIVPAITPPLSNLLAAITFVTLCYSFLVDAVWLWRRPARTWQAAETQ